MKQNLPEKKLKLSSEVLTAEITQGVSLAQVSTRLKAISAFQMLVRSQLHPNLDYGIIPGTQKPTLLKPGAEKIAKLLNCADKYEILEKIEDWEKPLFSYKIKCRLVTFGTENLISEGLGECNSLESKYRYRWVYENQIPKHLLKEDLVTKEIRTKTGGKFTLYRIDNDEIYIQVNTILKMSKKRALVDAALCAGRLSDIFTQDIEEKIEIETAEAKENSDKSNNEADIIQSDNGIEPTEKISKNQIEQIKTIAQRKLGEKWDVKLLTLIGAEFGVEAISELNTDQVNSLLNKLSEK